MKKSYRIYRDGEEIWVGIKCETAEEALAIYSKQSGKSADGAIAKEPPEKKDTPEPVYYDYDPNMGSEDECCG